jgi:predicted nuclease of predicted toxin-antitoxin system
LNNASSPDTFTLFVDRDAWSAKLDAALRAAGIPFIAHRDVFAHNTPDEEWLAEAGRRGWLVFTRDQNIRRRPDELKALRDAGVILFALTSGNLSAQETAELAVASWLKITRLAAKTTPPAIFSITRGGEIRRIER